MAYRIQEAVGSGMYITGDVLYGTRAAADKAMSAAEARSLGMGAGHCVRVVRVVRDASGNTTLVPVED